MGIGGSEDEFIFKVGKKLGFTISRLNDIRSKFVENEQKSSADLVHKKPLIYLN